MSQKLSGLELTAATTKAMAAVADWVDDPESQPVPSRQKLADAVRRSAELLAQDAPGNAVELRVPPFVAVQCVAGPVHRRGNPPNVVQCSPLAWLRAAAGVESLTEMSERAGTEAVGGPMGKISVELSGTRASEVERHLPLFGRH
ncbi:sterol carrier family protein [Corynebacterium sp. UMB9976]|uniref:sterol carrier family protein n=1 Tax=Corynebacterium sp. UMB9976 TaxID=3046354 RepID=UPI00254B7AC8|nr:sterol carrier family protein [Corynebacterium sp. UMB9976]MDK6301993.1 sterol carrier family protein [Corynebacterium sp. UMB9976]